MIDFDTSISSPLLERDGDARQWPVDVPAPTIDIVLANFSGGQGNGYSVRANINFTAQAVVLLDGKPWRPHPARVKVEQLSPSFLKEGEQFCIRAIALYPMPPTEGQTILVRFGWGAQGHIEVNDGRGQRRILWLPEGLNGDFAKGGAVPAADYRIKFEVRR